ncbi:MAG: DNA polymerase [Candidatus Acidiferrales bacterium]
MSQGQLQFGEKVIAPEIGRALPPLPDLSEVESLGFDTETTVEPRLEDRSLVGLSFRLPSGRKQYVPIRHPGGGNYEVQNVKDWLWQELNHKQLVCANGKHEVSTLLRFGVDLEEQGCSLNDVFFSAALLNDHRYRLNMGLLCQEEFPDHKRIEANHATIYQMTAAEAAPIAIEDADLAWNLNLKYAPRIEDEGLENVLELENNLIYCTTAMERNGAYLDVPKLIRWNKEVQVEWEARIIRIHHETGLRVDPGKRKDMQKLFLHLGLKETGFKTEGGEESFTEEALDGITHPVIVLAKECRQLASLLAKYLRPYLERVAPDGRITYQLHQLRGDEFGTITGRYSSSKDKNGLGINVQQISKREKQPLLLQRWDIRELFIPPPGRVWASADASQIELRFLAHHAAMLGMTRLAKAYRENPWVDFHNLMVEWTGLIRDHAKNVTFAKTYGGGIDKIAGMCKVSRKKGEEIVAKYDREFPEAKRLIYMASDQAERVGYVRTFMGRRRRYTGTGERYYSSLNSVLQGGAADLAKIKLLESYVAREKLGLTIRYPVHDEINGDQDNKEAVENWGLLLNEQTSDLAVPIMWKVGSGNTWGKSH